MKVSVKTIVIAGIMTALVFLVTYFSIPYGFGNINLGDTIIFITSIFFGPFVGMISGGIGAALSDLISGYTIYAPFTFVIKALMGLVVGLLARKDSSVARIVFTIILGAVIMVGGYFISEAYILGLLDKTYGLAAAITDLTGNLIQGGVSAVLSIVLAGFLKNLNYSNGSNYK